MRKTLLEEVTDLLLYLFFSLALCLTQILNDEFKYNPKYRKRVFSLIIPLPQNPKIIQDLKYTKNFDALNIVNMYKSKK